MEKNENNSRSKENLTAALKVRGWVCVDDEENTWKRVWQNQDGTTETHTGQLFPLPMGSSNVRGYTFNSYK